MHVPTDLIRCVSPINREAISVEIINLSVGVQDVEKTPHAHIDSAYREESFAPVFSPNGPQEGELWRVKVGGGWVGVLDPLRQDTLTPFWGFPRVPS